MKPLHKGKKSLPPTSALSVCPLFEQPPSSHHQKPALAKSSPVEGSILFYAVTADNGYFSEDNVT
jgi:hypothetical protein